MKKVTVGRTEPVAFVTKGKHRLKQYNNKSTVYLRNGDEFELELFNPTSEKVLAKIELNGKSLGSGVVLRPGERVFLERYLDEARKFSFSTYEVNGKSEEVKKAIANNGDVQVFFYTESTPFFDSVTTWITNWPTYGNPSYTTHDMNWQDNSTLTFGSSGAAGSLDTTQPINAFYTNTMAGDGEVTLDMISDVKKRSVKSFSKSLSKNVETGRIDKGSESDQKFNQDYTTFNSYWTWVRKWKILPLSQKEVVSEDIKVFCTNCGTRQRKSSHKFCPNCGTKY